MTFPLKIAIVLAALAFPLLEIALLIKAAGLIGFWGVVALVILTAILGANIIRARGVSAFSKIFAHVEAGRSGFEPMADTFLAVMGGALLILPGVICDTLGALLLVPPIRAALIRTGLARMLAGGFVHTEVYEGHFSAKRPGEPDWGSRENVSGSGASGAPVIDGEYERIDDQAPRR